MQATVINVCSSILNYVQAFKGKYIKDVLFVFLKGVPKEVVYGQPTYTLGRTQVDNFWTGTYVPLVFLR